MILFEVTKQNSTMVTAVELKAIFGSIGTIISIIGAIYAGLRYYYTKKWHCQAKPTNVDVKTDFKYDGRKFIVVKWTVPQRGKLDTLTCIVKGVRITCSGSEYCDADGCTMLPSRTWERDNHNVNDKNYQEIFVDEYWKHEIQVEMIYEGRLFGAEHPSEPSDKNELCHLCAPSNKPLIKSVGYTDRFLGIVWEKPTRPNGDILNYKLKIQQVGRTDNVQYITFPVPSSDQKTEDGYDVHNQHVQLEPNKYNVSLSAENKDFTGQGEWSSSYILCVEKEMTLGPTAKWSRSDWNILTTSVIPALDRKVFMLGTVLEVDIQKLNIGGANMDVIAIAVLETWKEQKESKANLHDLGHHFEEFQYIHILQQMAIKYKSVTGNTFSCNLFECEFPEKLDIYLQNLNIA